MRFVWSLALAFAFSSAYAITATKAYVDAATNATLVAAKEYTDQHGGGGGGVAPPSVTNIAEYAVNRYDATNLTARIASKVSAADAGLIATNSIVSSGCVTTNEEGNVFFYGKIHSQIDGISLCSDEFSVTFPQDYGTHAVTKVGSTDGKLLVGGTLGGRVDIAPGANNNNPGMLYVGAESGVLSVGPTNIISALYNRIECDGTTNSVSAILSSARSDSETIAADARLYEMIIGNAYSAASNSVQYVDITNATLPVNITPPAAISGRVSDWVVYLFAAADTANAISFDGFGANHLWAADAAATNVAVKTGITMLSFSQIKSDTYIIGRQALKSVSP